MERGVDLAKLCAKEKNYAMGGPRCWVLSEARREITGDAARTESCPSVVLLKTLEETFSGVECEVSAPRRRYGQLAALLRKPSPLADSAQWCLPSRRQHAGTALGCACRKGEANPKHNKNSKLAATRRMRTGLVLHNRWRR